MRRTLVYPILLVGLFVASLTHGAGDTNPAAVDEETLRAAGVATDGPGLLAFFRKQTTAEPTRAQVLDLLRQLGHDTFEMREKASAALVGLGAAAEPHLKQTIEDLKRSGDADLEVLRRAEDCLRRIGDRAVKAAVLAAAARTVARQKPTGAIEALLGYLPSAPGEQVTDAIQAALTALTDPNAPDAALLAALTDKVAPRRAVAGAVVAPAPGESSRAAVKKLLSDTEAVVRHRVALALAAAGEKDAVTVLIDLLTELPQAHAYHVEQMLCRLADEQAPPVPYGNKKEARTKCRDAWAAWWKENAGNVVMTRLHAPGQPLGYTLVVLLEDKRVLELDAKNQVRWEMRGVDFPLDAQLLPGGRVLLAEQNANAVRERTLKGDVIWERKIGEPLMAQRLADGNTFIATRSQLVEVDRDGAVVFTWTSPFGDSIMRAQKLTNGQIVLVTDQVRASDRSALFRRLDPTATRELATFPVQVKTSGGRIEVLPNQHVLAPEKDGNRVAEYDARGTVVWQVPVGEPIAAVRLANGNTLVTSMNELRAVEFNLKGEKVWEYRAESKVTRAFRR